MEEPTARRGGPLISGPGLRRRWRRWLAAPPLRERELKRYILLALVYRAVSPLLALSYVAQNPQEITSQLDLVLIVVGVVFVGNVSLIAAVMQREPNWFADSVRLRVVDLGFAVLLEFWAASVVVEGTLFLPYRDILWIYAVATVALWTGVRQSRTGLVLVAVSVPLQVAMGLINGVPIEQIPSGQFVAREGWLLLGFVVGSFHISIAREARDAARAAGRRAGREAERAQALRELHDTSLQTLDGIALRAELEGVDPKRTLHEIGAEARRQAARVRVLLKQRLEERGTLYGHLESLVAEVEGRGIVVPRWVPVGPEPPLSDHARAALVGAVGEALRNVERHAAAQHVTIFLEADDLTLQITVRDDGRGFDESALHQDAFGVHESIRHRLVDAGGSATLLTAPTGQGTTWELCVPLARTQARLKTAKKG